MILIKGGNVYGIVEETADVLIKDDRIVQISESIPETDEMTVIDACGLVVAPGFVDLHVHFREPGFIYKEDIMTGAMAAAAGGVTTCLCMPNTSPVVDDAKTLRYIADRTIDASIRVLPVAAVTLSQKGKELTDFEMLKNCGAAALSDDGNPISSAAIMREALIKAKKTGLTIISHCEDEEMVKNYAVNEGEVSKKLNLPGRPAIAEEIMVARDVMLSAETGAHVHIAHISTAASVEIVRRAKLEGINVTAETCPQYFSLTQDEVLRQGALARVNPPLRTALDVAGIIEGLVDGTIDCIATDHAPHSVEEKSESLANAPSGMIGLETSLALALTYLYHTGKLGIDDIIKLMATNPAGVLGLDFGTLLQNACADVVIFDPNEDWIVRPEKFHSKARNTAFAQMKLKGRVKHTISRGKLVYSDN